MADIGDKIGAHLIGFLGSGHVMQGDHGPCRAGGGQVRQPPDDKFEVSRNGVRKKHFLPAARHTAERGLNGARDMSALSSDLSSLLPRASRVREGAVRPGCCRQ